MIKRPKAHTLPISIRIKIGKHKTKHPDMPMTQIAELYNVTYDQARQAYLQYKSGKLNKYTKKIKSEPIEKIRENKSPEDIIKSQYHTALAGLESDRQIPAIDRINALEKLARTRKLLQSVELTEHIKRADADVIGAIIRRYNPDATDEDIIKIYKEELAKIQMESGNWNI